MPRTARKARKRAFGRINQERSGRYTAWYNDPDGRTKISASGTVTPVRHRANHTFETTLDAEAWLAAERRLISTSTWTSPAQRRQEEMAADLNHSPTFGEYASAWIDSRKNKSGKSLAPRTRDHYHQLLADYLEPTFGYLLLDEITPAQVNIWYDAFTPLRKKLNGVTGETTKAHAYSLARAVLNTATSAHGPLVGRVNPFAVRGGGTSPVRKRTQVATSAQFKVMLTTIRPEWELILLLGCWAGLRYSEIAELRRGDINLVAEVIQVSRSVTRSKVEGVGVKSPKSEAGIRDQIIPPNVLPALKRHMRAFVTGQDGLLFPGKNGRHLAPVTFYGKVPPKPAETPEQAAKQRARNGWYAARSAAGCPTLRFHDLRATGATLLAQQGGTVADVQLFLGDSTAQAALRYVRSAEGRQKVLADKLAALDGSVW
ncbi:tyrosine-type recombinase/integrase [Flexivirga lutea]